MGSLAPPHPPVLNTTTRPLPAWLPQVFAHSLFDFAELHIMLSHWTGEEFENGPALIAKRLGFRYCFLAASTALAACLPFILDLLGLIGAVGYAHLCFVLPCTLWLLTQRGQLSRCRVALYCGIAAGAALVGAAAAVGSVRGLVVHSGSYKFFA